MTPRSPRIRRGTAAIAVVAALALAATSSASAMNVSATINVGASPQTVAVTPDGLRAYVPNQADDSVSVINTVSNTVATTMAGILTPQGVAISSGGVAVVSQSSPPNLKQATVINTATETVSGSAVLGLGPAGVAFSPDGSAFFVAEAEHVTKYGATAPHPQIAQSAQVVNAYSEVAVSPDGTRVWATSYNDGTVTVFDAATMATLQTLTIGFGMIGVAITPDGSTAYTTRCSSGELLAINTATFAISTGISVPGCPWGVAINPAGTLAAVTQYSGNTVSAVDLATGAVVDTATGVTNPAGLAMSPSGDTLYVALRNSDAVAVLPFGPPGTPTAPTALAGNSEATVSWATATGQVATYTVTSVQDPSKTCTATAPAVSCTVTGLTNGTAYTFRVRAVNPMGPSGTSAASAAVTPGGATPSPDPVPTPAAPQAADSTSTPATATPATLSATLLPSRRRMVSGQRMTAVIRLGNSGGSAAESATGCLTVPRNLMVVAAPGARQSHRTMCFAMGNIAPGGHATRTVTLRAVASTASLATISGSGRAAGISRVSARPAHVTIARRAPERAIAG